MQNYNSSWSMSYKGQTIQGSHYDGKEHIRVLYDGRWFCVKSLHAAKIKITRMLRGGINEIQQR